MRVHEKWSKEIEHGSPVWSLGFSDHLDFILVPTGNEVVPLDRSFGEIKTSPRLKAHKARVISITVSLTGKKIASSDRDGVVVIWKSTGEGLVKYSHGSAVRAVAFDPLDQILASGSETEIGFWIAQKKTVEKTRTSAAVWSLKWSADGMWLVAGFADGSISGFDRTGKKRWSYTGWKKLICWTLDIIGDQLLAGMWDLDKKSGCIGFLSVSSGSSISAPCWLDPDSQPTSAVWISSRSALVGTTRGTIELITLGGKRVVKTLHSTRGSDEWITCLVVAQNKSNQQVFYTSTSGRVCNLKIYASTVHGQHRGVYAVRDKETLTDIVVFPCDDASCTSAVIGRIVTPQVVDNIAIYNGKIACESHKTISVYSMKDGNLLIPNIETKSSPSSLLLLAEFHVIVCPEPHKLVAFNKKSIEKEWTFPALIRYAKVVDGPPGRESVLIGLSDGQVLLAYLANSSSSDAQAVKVLSHTSGIRFLDISLGKTEIAVIDETSFLSIYSLVGNKRDIIVSFPSIMSVSFNETIPSLLALTDASGNVSIIDLEFPDIRSQQHVQGTVLSFRHNTVSVIVEGQFFPRVFVSISNIATRHSEVKNHKMALSLASDDPHTLQIIAQNCIQSGHNDLACKAFAKMNCYKKIISLSIGTQAALSC